MEVSEASASGLALYPDKTRLVPFRRPRVPSARLGGGPSTGHVRPVGFHPLLGTDPAGRMGGDAQDGLEAGEAAWCGASRNGAG